MKQRDQEEHEAFFAAKAQEVATPKINDAEFARLIKELANDDTFFLICQALFNAEDEIAIGASLILGRIRDKRAVPFLLKALLTNNHKRGEAIMWSLGEIADIAALPFLLTALRANFIPKSAILALGKIGSRDAVDAILQNLGSSDEAVRLLAVKAIGQIRFFHDDDLKSKASHSLAERLLSEASRRVKLLLAVVKSRLEMTTAQ